MIDVDWIKLFYNIFWLSVSNSFVLAVFYYFFLSFPKLLSNTRFCITSITPLLLEVVFKLKYRLYTDICNNCFKLVFERRLRHKGCGFDSRSDTNIFWWDVYLCRSCIYCFFVVTGFNTRENHKLGSEQCTWCWLILIIYFQFEYLVLLLTK